MIPDQVIRSSRITSTGNITLTETIATAEDLLAAYYDALSAENFAAIPGFFASTVTVVTLAGSTVVTGSDNIEKLYRKLIETWRSNGISPKIGYDRAQFTARAIQGNAEIVQTRLSNYTHAGEIFHNWHCTYVVCRGVDGWRIVLATSDNETTASAPLK